MAATTLAGMRAPRHPPDSPTLPAAPTPAAPSPSPPRGGTAWRQIAGVLGWRIDPAPGNRDTCAISAALVACLADLPAIDTSALRQVLIHAGSLAELWHLRPEVYRLLALHHSQAEAEQRLAATNRLFEPAA